MAWGCDLSYDYVKINAGKGVRVVKLMNSWWLQQAQAMCGTILCGQPCMGSSET